MSSDLTTKQLIAIIKELNKLTPWKKLVYFKGLYLIRPRIQHEFSHCKAEITNDLAREFHAIMETLGNEAFSELREKALKKAEELVASGEMKEFFEECLKESQE